MKNLCKRLKLNNKGDTLAIVLIGMLIIGVLGTIILKASSVNVEMKTTNLKSKQNFYYVERAVDDIYAGIGKDVSKAIQTAYDKTINGMITKDASGDYKKKNSGDLKDNFTAEYIKELKNMNYNNTIPITDLLEKLERFPVPTEDSTDPDYDPDAPNLEYYKNLGVTIDVKESSDPYKKTEVIPPTVSPKHNFIIKNVVITSTSNKNKYKSSITTDFVIEIPEINFNFDDNPDSELSELYKYAIIADGQVNKDRLDANGNPELGAISVTNGNVEINGNIYAGEYHDYINGPSTQWKDKDGIYVGNNGTLNIYGANVISKGAVKLGKVENNSSESGKIVVNPENEVKNKHLEKKNLLPTARLWTNDINLAGNDSAAEINGDCFVKDDLEVNGNRCAVDIYGSYYGFGFQGTIDMDKEIAVEDNSGEMQYVLNSENPELKPEHELRSAVIVNGNDANVQLTKSGGQQFVLGGRAYIDLSNSNGSGMQTRAADYMTGESISIKGNQKMYLLDNPSNYQTENPNIPGNPISTGDLQGLGITGNYTTDQFYQLLHLKKEEVVAKKVGESIYFYNRQVDPNLQTDYVVENVKSTIRNGFDILNQAVTNMKIENLSLGDDTKSYTVGTAMQVKNHSLTTTADNRTLPYLENGIEESEFTHIIKDVEKRYKAIMYDFSDDRNEPVGSQKTKVTETTDSDSPYEHFIDATLLGKLGAQLYPFEILTRNNTNTVKQEWPVGSGKYLNTISAKELEDEAGIQDGQNTTVELLVADNNSKKYDYKIQTANNLKGGNTVYGVIICTGDVEVNCNFEGMIVCGGDITITGDYTFTANPKLMKFLYNKSEYLQDLIGGSAMIITPPKGDTNIIGQDGEEYAFDAFVNMENWRKNED